MQPTIDRFYSKKDSDSEKLARLAEVKFSGFIAEHNLPFAEADHLAKLIKVSFPDSKVANSYTVGKTKTTCILNWTICRQISLFNIQAAFIVPFVYDFATLESGKNTFISFTK